MTTPQRTTTVDSTQLYNKYRPKVLNDVIDIGNEKAITQLKGMVGGAKWPSAIALFGPTSSGKTTLAYAIGCSTLGAKSVSDNGHPSFTEVTGTVSKSIDDVRGLIAVSRQRPMHGARRFILIDEAQGLLSNKQAAGALLGALERPPASTTWILTSMSPQAFMSSDEGRAIANRATQFKLKPPSEEALAAYVKKVIIGESMEYARTAELVKAIVDASNSEYRTAANLLQGLQMYYSGLPKKPKTLDAEAVSAVVETATGASDDALAAAFVLACLNGKVTAAIRSANSCSDRFMFISKVTSTISYAVRAGAEKTGKVNGAWPPNAYRAVSKEALDMGRLLQVFPYSLTLARNAAAFVAPLEDLITMFAIECFNSHSGE